MGSNVSMAQRVGHRSPAIAGGGELCGVVVLGDMGERVEMVFGSCGGGAGEDGALAGLEIM